MSDLVRTLQTMPSFRLTLALDPAALLAQATEGLFPLAAPTTANPWPTLSAWLVLRQGGLRDDLHRLAAEEGVAGWFDPPVCLFAELASRWGVPGGLPLSPEERLALLTWVIDRHAAGVFDRHGSADAWVPAIDRLIGELIGEGVTHEAFTAAMSGREDRDDFERERDARLTAIYADWHFALRSRTRSDGRDGLVRLARFIGEQPEIFAQQLGGRRDVRIVGLADLRGGWRPLLTALAQSPALDRVTIVASSPLELPSSLLAEHRALAHDVPTHWSAALAGALFRDSPPATAALSHRLHLLEAPDAAREIEQVAVRVRALLDRGVAPERIAVVLRLARPGVDRMADALEALGVPVTARRRTALLHTGPAQAVRAVLKAAIEQFSRHAVVELAEHPLLAFTLDADVLHAVARVTPIHALEEWEPALQSLLLRCRHRDARPDDWRANRGLPPTAATERTLEAWRNWLPLARALTRERTTSAWFSWVHDVLTSAEWGVSERLAVAPGGDNAVWRADVLACERIVALAREWADALHDLQITELSCSAAVFGERLRLVLDADLVTQPETGFGVTVAEALAAGWRSFDHVFVAGLIAGSFPGRQPQSALLTDRERRSLIAAGLPLDAPDRWRVREQELFRVLCAAPRDSLTLSWSASDDSGREVPRSAYADEMLDVAVRALQRPDEQRPDEQRPAEQALMAAGILTHVPTQQMITPGFALLSRGEAGGAQEAQEAQQHAMRVAAIERERTRAVSVYNGHIDDEAMRAVLAARYGEPYPWSASQLEELAKCGWSWFASRVLKLDTRADLDGSMEATTRGTLLHEALRVFYEDARARLATGLLLSRHAPEVKPMLQSALDRAWTAQQASSWMGTPRLHALVRAELLTQLVTYVQFEIAFNEKHADNRTTASKQIRMAVRQGELSFEQVLLQGGAVSFMLRGSIDRVDYGDDDRIDGAEQYFAAIDYKSSIGSTPAGGNAKGWDDGVVLQVPLYAKALQAQHPGATLARLEYRTLRSPKAVHTLQLHKVVRQNGRFEVQPVAESELKLTRALADAGRRVELARRGEFAASPAPSCGCSPYCVARDICRLPGGPESFR